MADVVQVASEPDIIEITDDPSEDVVVVVEDVTETVEVVERGPAGPTGPAGPGLTLTVDFVSSPKDLLPNVMYEVDAGSGPFTLTLPLAASMLPHDRIIVEDKNATSSGSRRVTIAAQPGEFIADAKASVFLSRGNTLTFRSNGTGWVFT